MRFGIRLKLYLASLALIALSFVVVDVYLGRALDADLTARVRSDLLVRLNFIAKEASTFGSALDDRGGWDGLADELGRLGEGRVTIIRRDGVVLGDSEIDPQDLGQVANHSDRPELMQALAGGHGTSTRWSSTLRVRMMYVAVPLPRDGAAVGTVRLAVPLAEVDDALRHLRRLVYGATGLALACATVLALLASQWMSKGVRGLTAAAQRMAAGDLATRTRASGHDEVAELGRALDQLASGLQGALGTLGRERDLMGRVLERMQEGVLLLDEAGRVALANAALRDALLLGPEVAGRSLLEMVRNAALKEVLDEAALASEPVSAELELGDIKPRRWLVHAAALRDDPKGVLAVFVDVTALRRLEALRRDFVANVSHELRTPVASVRSAAETLHRALETQPEAAGEFVEIIVRNTDRLHRLIEDLLDLSRIESRELRLSLETLDLGPVVQHTLSTFRERAQAKGLRLSAALPAGLPPVRADRRALDQVLTNLVDNALKYCPAGAAVVIGAASAAPTVRVSVEDTGPGIDPQHLPRLFERFYRVDAGRSRELGGTGLGLSIVKHLVEAMQGEVGVESALGRGSCFFFTLPTA